MFKRLDSQPDVLTDVLTAIGLESALSSRVEACSPWSLWYGRETGHRAGFHVVLEGSCLVVAEENDEPVALAAGDIVLLPHGIGHRIASDLVTPPEPVHEMAAGLVPGAQVALPFGDGGERAVVLCGSYSFGPEGANPLLRGLPDLLHVTAGSGADLDAAIALLARESTGTFPGSALVIDRMVNVLFVLALRSWMTAHANEAGTTWFGALTDPVVGPAVQAIHADPAQTWTVETLASHANLSRAAFARRFGDAVGEPPLAYVTRWRMTVAASLLAGGERVASVAQQVGYGNEFAFAKAFKRVRGVAPGTFRVQSRHAMAHQLSR